MHQLRLVFLAVLPVFSCLAYCASVVTGFWLSLSASCTHTLGESLFHQLLTVFFLTLFVVIGMASPEVG